ncbi:MAG: 30S ribosomal protein S8 [Patescibacteria group bacterium]
MIHDPLANMLISLKNAALVKIPSVEVPFSNLKLSVAEVLASEGYLTRVVKKGKKIKKFLELDLAYKATGEAKIKEVLRVSKPSRRVYLSLKEIIPVRRGFGRLILSTPKGILTGEQARRAGVGGEALFKIW